MAAKSPKMRTVSNEEKKAKKVGHSGYSCWPKNVPLASLFLQGPTGWFQAGTSTEPKLLEFSTPCKMGLTWFMLGRRSPGACWTQASVSCIPHVQAAQSPTAPKDQWILDTHSGKRSCILEEVLWDVRKTYSVVGTGR